MKEQFAIVNQKLDLLEQQLEGVEDRIIYEIFKNEFLKYEATLGTCGARLRFFQDSPTEGTKQEFQDQCCTGDTSPLKYLYWMGNNVPKFIQDVVEAKEYQMDTFLNEMQAIVYST
mmetsp:Transcript_23525/g.35731  ORF Transcript_23525/g.35731 Transcript_23525/m.35731 type:complete len:116 (+) Transcript_23525:771-1118(+)